MTDNESQASLPFIVLLKLIAAVSPLLHLVCCGARSFKINLAKQLRRTFEELKPFVGERTISTDRICYEL